MGKKKARIVLITEMNDVIIIIITFLIFFVTKWFFFKNCQFLFFFLLFVFVLWAHTEITFVKHNHTCIMYDYCPFLESYYVKNTVLQLECTLFCVPVQVYLFVSVNKFCLYCGAYSKCHHKDSKTSHYLQPTASMR